MGLAIAGIPLGIYARRQIDKSEGRLTGRSFATAGIVLGVLYLVAVAIIIIVLVAGTSKSTSGGTTPVVTSAPASAETRAAAGAAALWRPTDPVQYPAVADLHAAGLRAAEGEQYEAVLKLTPLANKRHEKKGEGSEGDRRNCVVKRIYGTETPNEVKEEWLVIALRRHEAAAEEAVTKAERACAQAGQ